MFNNSQWNQAQDTFIVFVLNRNEILREALETGAGMAIEWQSSFVIFVWVEFNIKNVNLI